MSIAFVILVVIHALIHLLGAAKAFGWADLPQLSQAISPLVGLLWLVAALLFGLTAVSYFAWSRWWWAIAALAIVASTIVISQSWTDAKVGALANVIIAVGAVFGFLSQGPLSLRAQYDADVAGRLASVHAPGSITEADLADLPALVQGHLRRAGVVGSARINNYKVTMHGRIRSGPSSRWMPFEVEQINFVDPPARMFYMNASMFAVPIQGFHRYADESASMKVKAAALVTVAAESGREMTTSETVTLFNDMCLLAPATLIDRRIAWEPIDARTVRGRFTNAGITIAADLIFDEDGRLVDFISDDRYQSATDGSGMRKVRWSTPVGGYRTFGSTQAMGAGSARWHEPGGEYSYIEVTVDDVRHNVRSR